jgi:hypothetical protein
MDILLNRGCFCPQQRRNSCRQKSVLRGRCTERRPLKDKPSFKSFATGAHIAIGASKTSPASAARTGFLSCIAVRRGSREGGIRISNLRFLFCALAGSESDYHANTSKSGNPR